MTNLEKAQEILAMLKAENISTDHTAGRISVIRKATEAKVAMMSIPGPGLTTCTATTLLKRGLCLELSQRFVLEYAIKFKQQNVSLLFTFINGEIHAENHIFVILGDINVPEHLIIGKGSSPTSIADDKTSYQLLETFIANNKNNIVVDALLGCAGTFSSEAMQPLRDYIEKYKVTHLAAVRSLHNSPMFIETAPTIKQNAVAVAAEVGIAMKREYLDLATNLVAPGEWKYVESKNYFMFEAKDPSKIQTVHDDLQSKGFLADKELTIAETLQTKRTLLFLKKGKELELARFETIGQIVKDSYKKMGAKSNNLK